METTETTRKPRPLPVQIVGGGPGAIDLITLRGRDALASADAVFYTGSLVPESLLAHCPTTTERIDTRSLTLEDWLPMLRDRALAGQRVVRLQDGDPSLYGAVHELVADLIAHDLPFEIIPGVSAFQAAAARLGAELTVPELVQTIILTRTSGAATTMPNGETLASLAAHRASLCLYLSAHHCDRAQADLIEHYGPDAPVAVCYRIGWDDEFIEVGPLSAMAAITRREKLTRTVLYLVSPALTARDGHAAARSGLYSASHSHLFRRKASPTT